MANDGQLLRCYAESRSEAAFAELVRRHLGLVFQAARRRLGGDAHAAADVSQGVFLLLARKATSLDRHPSLAGWLYSAVNFEVSALLRAARRRRLREQEAGARIAAAGTSDPLRDGEFLRPIIDDAIMTLGPTDREAVVLRFFEGCPFAELGKKLGLSEAAAQKRVDRALEKLRVFLAQRRIPSTAAALAVAMASQSGLAAPPALAAALPSAIVIAAGMQGAGRVGLFQLICSAPLTSGIAGLALVAIGIGAYQVREAERAESALPTARAEFARAQGRLQNLPPEGAHRGRAATAPGRAAIVLPTADRPAQNPQEAGRKFLAAVPEARGMLMGTFRVEASRAYGPFLRSAGMSSAEIEKFEDAVVATRMEHLALTAKGFSDTSTLLPPDDQLQALLGDQRYQEFEDFRPIQPAFGFVAYAAVAAGLAGAPLSNDEQDQLVQVLVQNSPAAPAGGLLDLSTVNWDGVLRQVQAAVSPRQWNALQADLLHMQYAQALAAAQAEAASTPTPVGSR
jgi:RNA polymerase sigma factor (sigma-70 family)